MTWTTGPLHGAGRRRTSFSGRSGRPDQRSGPAHEECTHMTHKRRPRRLRSGEEVPPWRLLALLVFMTTSSAFTFPRRKVQTTCMVSFSHAPRQRITFPSRRPFDFKKQRERLRRARYQRKQIPDTEKELQSLRRERQAEFDRIMERADAQGKTPSIWSFESLFPGSVIDTESVHKDLFGAKERDIEISSKRRAGPNVDGGSPTAPDDPPAKRAKVRFQFSRAQRIQPPEDSAGMPSTGASSTAVALEKAAADSIVAAADTTAAPVRPANATFRVDRGLTRLMEDRLYGMRRTADGTFDATTYLVDEGAVQFRDGVRVGNPLKINADRLNYLAKKEFRHGRIEEAQELYEQAVQTDPRDGRGYLGLSRCAERRRDFKLARSYLKAGISKAISSSSKDRGANPFLLQALGCLEERMGNLAQAEALYLAATRSRPSHAAAWVSLAQLRTRKLGQTVNSGRICYQQADIELKKAALPPSSYVYTAWAAMEYRNAGDVRRARELFKLALKADPSCSAALLQLGVMEADTENWKDAEEHFETALKFDKRNSRVLQAYAIMESKRPGGSSRKAIDLFERALRVNGRDAGVLQAYALYVANLGDIDAARDLLIRGTKVNKRHAPVWQAWGVLETRHGAAEEARKVFQQGIWACAQLNGDYSGGYHCARLWQAWGVLEAREKDFAAARRCFSRALDADSRNVPSVTAWAAMEADIGNIRDARSIFERALPKYAPGSDEKMTLWRSYELMEQRQANVEAAQQVYQRAMGEAITATGSNEYVPAKEAKEDSAGESVAESATDQDKNEVEVIRWVGGGRKVWMKDRAIESRLPFDLRNRKKAK